MRSTYSTRRLETRKRARVEVKQLAQLSATIQVHGDRKTSWKFLSSSSCLLVLLVPRMAFKESRERFTDYFDEIN